MGSQVAYILPCSGATRLVGARTYVLHMAH